MNLSYCWIALSQFFESLLGIGIFTFSQCPLSIGVLLFQIAGLGTRAVRCCNDSDQSECVQVNDWREFHFRKAHLTLV